MCAKNARDGGGMCDFLAHSAAKSMIFVMDFGHNMAVIVVKIASNMAKNTRDGGGMCDFWAHSAAKSMIFCDESRA